tara:strand:- start:412 stop:597 length:186 start_codon:yes stop_codon:yes gene_type:complete
VSHIQNGGVKEYDKKKVCFFAATFKTVKDANFVRIEGVEPTRLTALDPKSSVSTNSTISAW